MTEVDKDDQDVKGVEDRQRVWMSNPVNQQGYLTISLCIRDKRG